MSTNERDWFAPRNDPRREDDPPPPPPSQEPPPGLGAHSGRGAPPPGQGRHFGHGLPAERDPRLDQDLLGEETAPVPRVPSAGDLPGRGGRGTPPPGYDTPEGRPSGPQEAMGWPDVPREPMGRPNPPQEALEWPSAPQGPAYPPSSARGQGPAHAGGPAQERSRAQEQGPAHARGPAQEQGPAHARGPAQEQGPAHARGPAHGQGPAHSQGPAHAQGPAQRPGLPPRPVPQQPRARHAAHGDQQVWPPAPREPVGGTTQPLPAVPAAIPVSPPQGPGTPLPRRQNPEPEPAAHPVPGPEPEVPQEAPPGPGRAAAPAGRKKRTVLVAVAAVVVSLVTMGAQSYDGYLFYEKTTTKETKETVVPAGQAATVKNIEWRATVTRIKMPDNLPYGPEVAALRVDITKKVLDEGSATKTALFEEAKLEDRAGRSWVVNIDPGTDRPTDRLEVGKEYKILAAAVVPTAVADEVELSFRPSNYRSDTPTADLFKRDTATKLEGNVDVLRFRRR
ncbi:hypothetical protein ACIBO5_06340 [Nonomuraea angiospora]|uniref:hypothetical protein n=1 Tax=Nonomuraea angiospora TaxID=46172 RepID=UPI0037B05490